MARGLQDEASTTEQLSGFSMYASPQRRSHNLTWKLPKQAGWSLRELRENRGLPQRELAQKVGADALIAQEFTLDMLASLFREGLATAWPQRTHLGRTTIDIARIGITGPNMGRAWIDAGFAMSLVGEAGKPRARGSGLAGPRPPPRRNAWRD